MAIKTEWRDPNGLTGISCLSSDTKPDAPAGSICWETDTGNRFERDGDTWQPSGTGGAAHVTTAGSAAIVERRTCIFDNAPASVAITSGVVTFAAANLTTFTFDSANDYKRVVIRVISTGTTAQEYIAFTINAPDDATAANTLTHDLVPSSATADAGVIIIQPGEITERQVGAAITRIDFAAVGTTPAADNGFVVHVEVA